MVGTREKVINKLQGSSAWNSQPREACDKYYFVVDIKYDIMKWVIKGVTEARLFGQHFEGSVGFVTGREEYNMTSQATVDSGVLHPDFPLGLSHSFFHMLRALVVDSSWLSIFLWLAFRHTKMPCPRLCPLLSQTTFNDNTDWDELKLLFQRLDIFHYPIWHILINFVPESTHQ